MQVQSQTSTSPTQAPQTTRSAQRTDASAERRPTLMRNDLDSPAVAARLEAIGAQHGFALNATRAMAQAIANGGGGMAQFDHPALGGSGQWMRGGMVMIGDMFNRELAGRVGALGNELAGWLSGLPQIAASATSGTAESDQSSAAGAAADARHWWPAELHSPSSSGSQNGARYAYFADAQRLAIERAGSVELYDTGEHRISGVSQQQGSGRSSELRFSSQQGTIDLASLRRLERATPAADQPALDRSTQLSQPQPSAGSLDALDLLAKLADLHARGVLSDDEFTTKKSDLLKRI